MEKADKLIIVMPAYNEEANIEKVVSEWLPVLSSGSLDSKLIVNISGSNDRTEEILLNLEKRYSNIEIMKNAGNDYGSKVLSLYEKAILEGADYIFETDSDGQTSVLDFDGFWKERQNYDFIIGHRTNRQDGQLRILVSKVVVFLTFLYFGVRIPDANTPFRLMKKEKLEEYLHIIPHDYSMPNILLSILPLKRKEKVLFKEITFKNRGGGKNSMNYQKIFRIGLESLHTFRELKDKEK